MKVGCLGRVELYSSSLKAFWPAQFLSKRGASGDSLPTSGASCLHRTILYVGKVDTAATFWRCELATEPKTLASSWCGPPSTPD